MSPSTLTDAAVHRMIRRILTAPSTSSDSLLALADGLDEAAAWTDRNDAAAFLAEHAAALRKLAPCFADRPSPAAPPVAITPALAARILVRHHRVTEEDIGVLAFRIGSPMAGLVSDLVAAAEIEDDLRPHVGATAGASA